jgi:hypothetical protein
MAAIAAAPAVAEPVAEPRFEPGARGRAVTVLEGTERIEIPVRYIGTYEDFAGPGYDLHLVELEGPHAERVGVASGMSGSPVYLEPADGGDEVLLGALSYRLGALPRSAIAGVTPLRDVLDSVRRPAGGPPADDGKAGVAAIATPIVAGGLAPDVRDWLAERLDNDGFVLVAGGRNGSTSGDPSSLKPGSPVGVQLVRGDMSLAATGTVTWVEDGAVYAFGHPFFGAGPVEMPMVEAEVIHTLADMAGSVKLANVGAEIGAIVEDRNAAIVGRIGERARMVPVSLSVAGADYGEESYDFEIVKGSDLMPLFSGTAVANALRTNNGYSQKTTLLARGTIRLTDAPDLPLEMAFAGTGGSDPTFAVASELFLTLSTLWSNPIERVDVESVELQIEARSDVASYQVEALHYDRGALRAGQPLVVTCVLRKFRGDTETHEIVLDLPERLPRSGRLILAVGSPSGIDGVLGGRLARRLASAKDVSTVVDALSERRSAHRLTAIVYEPGKAVVSRGAAFTDLPPTVERLLSKTAERVQSQRPLVTPLIRAEIELDGPVQGGKQLRLRLERAPADSEDL